MEKSYDGGVAVDSPISTPVIFADISNIHIALGPMLDVLLQKRCNGIFMALHLAFCT